MLLTAPSAIDPKLSHKAFAGMTCLIEPVGCLDRFVVPPRKSKIRRSQCAKRQRGRSPERLKKGFPCGNAYPRLGWAGRKGQNAGQRLPKGRTKRLTFTEGRLRLPSQKALPDLKVRRLGWPCGGPMVLALNFSLHFLSREKEERVYNRRRRWRVKPAMTVWG